MGVLGQEMSKMDAEQREKGLPPLTPEEMEKTMETRLKISMKKGKPMPPSRDIDLQRQEDAFRECRNYTQIGDKSTCND